MSYPLRIIHTATVVFRLIDDFNGKLLNDSSFSFFAGSKAITPIKKTEGLYVIPDINLSENLEITIISANYCTYKVSDFSSLNPRCPVMNIRLKPGVCYPLQRGTTAYCGRFVNVYGKESSGIYTEVHSSFLDGSIRLKKVKKDKEATYTTLTNPYGMDYSGLFFSTSSEKHNNDCYIFNVVKRIDNLTFLVNETSGCAPDTETIVRRVYSSISDASGRVVIPVTACSNMENGDTFEVLLHATDGLNIYSKNINLIKGNATYFNETFEW